MESGLQLRIQRYGWDKASGCYETCWQQQLAPAQTRLLEMALLKPGEQVLDVACGTGLVTFRAARSVLPDGNVLGTDISEGMLEVARKAAQQQGWKNVSFQRMGAEETELPENSFDVALCALGLMYIPDPLRALSEMYRALKSGGRAAVLVWGARQHCGWAEIFPIVDRRVTSEVCPLFFRMGDRHVLSQSFCDAGFKEITVEKLNFLLHYNSAEEACAAAFSGGPVALAYHRFDEETRREAHTEYLHAIAPYGNQSGYDIPGEFMIAMGNKNNP